MNDFAWKRLTGEKLATIQKELLEESALDISYLSMTIGSCVIATFGLISNSAAVIIGAMIVAPLMLPIRSLAFGALSGSGDLFKKSAMAIGVGTAVSIILAYLIGLWVNIPTFGSEVLSRSSPTLLDLGIAIAAGAVSGFAKVEPKLSSSLAGTAIAVALMPPVCVIGLGLSHLDWTLSIGASILFLTNLLGIIFSCMVVFSITGCVTLRRGGKALSRTAIFTSLLLIPLGISFGQLWQQKALEALMQEVLINQTTTFQRMKLTNSRINWNSEPPEAYLDVLMVGDEKPTPKQIGLLEDFVEEETGNRFTLIVQLNQIEEIRRTAIPAEQ